MTELLASKVAIQEEEPQLRTIPGVSTSIIGLVGVAERGPVGEATLLTSWEDYLRIFGGYTADGELPMAVRGIYRQDPGAYVYVVRTVHYDPDATDPANKTSLPAEIMIQGTQATASAGSITGTVPGPWNLSPGDTLDIHVDEDVGGPETVTFDAVQATVVGSGLAITDINGETVILEMNNDGNIQTCTFTAAHAGDPDAAAAEMNAQLTGCQVEVDTGEIRITSDLYGTDSEIDIQGGTALTELGLSVGVTTEATSDVANIDAVTFAEVQARIAADVVTATVTVTQETGGEVTITSDTTGASSSVMVESSSTADTKFGFDNTLHSGSASSLVDTLKAVGKYDGTYAHDLRVVIADATSGDTDYFNLQHTTDQGVVLETFPNVQNVDDTADDFVETVVNADSALGGSRYLNYEDQAVGGGLRPDNGTYTPAAGDDGLASIGDNDYIGDSGGGTGLYALDLVNDLRLVAIPGQATSAIHNAMITYCESDREGSCFAVLDPASGWTAQNAVTYVETTAALLGLSEFGAIYWPRIKVLNPSKSVYGNTDDIVVPPAAWLCGVKSRTDRGSPGGQYQPAAGIERGRIFGCLGFETDEVLDIQKRNLVYPKRINPISREPGTPRFVDGTRTLKADGPFPSVSERRGVIYIEQSVKNGTVFARHSNNDDDQRARVFRTVYQFIKQQMKLGAFRTKDPATAFFVDVSDALNPPSVQFQNKLIGRVGLATAKPIDWVIFFFSQDTRALLEELGE